MFYLYFELYNIALCFVFVLKEMYEYILARKTTSTLKKLVRNKNSCEKLVDTEIQTRHWFERTNKQTNVKNESKERRKKVKVNKVSTSFISSHILHCKKIN